MGDMQRGAKLSRCGQYRYQLTRRWADGNAAIFLMLNPSTADAEQDDPTIRRCIGYARHWGYGGLMVFNLYAYRTAKPADLFKAADPVGPDNDAWLRAMADVAVDEHAPIVAAWGVNARRERVAELCRMRGMAQQLRALDTTKDGHPRHPLYLLAGLTPRPWEMP